MTVHAATATTMLDRMMTDPRGMQALHSTHQGLRAGRWSKEYMDAIGQCGVRARTSWPMEQVAAFAQVHSMVTRGLVVMVPVGTGGKPGKDDQREANAAALAHLPHPFTAKVDMNQNCGDGDGMVYWSEPIEVSMATGLIEREPDGTTRPVSLHHFIPPGRATLEIGSSLPSRTWMHLTLEGGAVARWPYGHSCFRLLVNLDYAEGIYRLGEALEPRRSQVLAQATLW
jgi:hypothetical protein